MKKLLHTSLIASIAVLPILSLFAADDSHHDPSHSNSGNQHSSYGGHSNYYSHTSRSNSGHGSRNYKHSGYSQGGHGGSSGASQNRHHSTASSIFNSLLGH